MRRSFIKRILLPVLAAALLCAGVSCNHNIVSDTFEASFILKTKTVDDGGDFSFTITCNHASFIVVKYSCTDGWVPDGFKPGSTVSVSPNEAQEFTARDVRVTSSHRGSLSITIQDSDTGAKKDFSAYYDARAAMNATLAISGYKPTGGSITSNVPYGTADPVAIIGGHDVSFTVEAPNHERLTLVSFEVPFAVTNPLMAAGKEWIFNKKKITVEEKAVKLTAAPFNEANNKDVKYLRLTFRDEVTGQTVDAEAPYFAFTPFEPEVEILTNPVYDGQVFRFRVRCDRPSAAVAMFSNAYDGTDLQMGSYGVNDMPDIEFTADGVYEFESSKPVSVTETENRTMILLLRDAAYTGSENSEKKLTASYTARVKDAPQEITVDTDKVIMNYDETPTLTISEVSPTTDSRFAARVLSGENIVSASVDANNPYSVILKGSLYNGLGGDAVVRVYSVASPSVYKDVHVTVRHRVVLEISGSFMAWSHGWDDVFQGVPVKGSVTASLMYWQGEDLGSIGNSYPAFYSLNRSDCLFSAELGAIMSPSRINNYDTMLGYSVEGSSYYVESDYANILVEKWRKGETPPFFSDGNFQLFEKMESVQSVSRYTLRDFCAWMYIYADICQIVGKPKHLTSSFTEFTPVVRNISYNGDLLDFRGVVYRWNHEDNQGGFIVCGNEWRDKDDDGNDRRKMQMFPWFYSIDRNPWFVAYTK